MTMKHTRLLRRTPIRKRRAGTRRGQPTAAEKQQIRNQVYAETGGMCELRIMPNCMVGPLPAEGGIRERWHLVHIKSKRVHGWGRANLCGGCAVCHLDGLHTKGVKLG